MKKFIASLAVSAALVSSLLVGSASAAGAGNLSLSPAGGSYTVGSSFNISVLVNGNGSPVNVVTMKVTYDASKLQINGTPGCGGAFGGYAGAAGAPGAFTLGCYVVPGAPVPTGSAVVASFNVTALAAGTANVNFAAGSQVASAGVDIWNGSTAGASYSLVNAQSTGSGGAGSTGSTSGGSSSSNSGAKAGVSGSAAHTSGSASTATNNGSRASATDNGTSANAATTDATGVKAATVNVSKTGTQTETTASKQSNTVAWILGSLLVVGLAVLAFLRRKQLGAFVANIRNKFSSKPAPKEATKTAASAVSSTTTAKRVSK